MQKKVAIQLGVIAAASIVLVLLSLPLLNRGGRGAGKALPVPSVPGVPKEAGSAAKPDSSGPVIKVRLIMDDKFYERLSRVAEALPIDRDPFSFVDTGAKSSREGLELSGILWEGEKPTAIIDQVFLNAGDSTDRFSVVKILRDRVILKDGAGEFELRLKQ